ncbi:MAG: DUF7151 family protein, partial [Poseidonia sp.]
MQPSAANEEQQRRSSSETNEEQHEEQPPHHRHRRWFTVLQTLTLVGVLLLAVYNNALLNTAPQEDLATPWLVESEPFAPLEPCNEGGIRLHTGFDVNGNNLLDAGERMDTAVLCNGLRGLSGPQGQAGINGVDAVHQVLETTTLQEGNETCPEGGAMMTSGLDLNQNWVLEESEVLNETVLCNGALGLDGTDGEHGMSGATALVDKVAAPSYICADGFLIRFGVDDGHGQGLAFNGVLEDDEVRETLNFCFEPLRSERVTDLVSGTGDSMTQGCDAAA